MKSNKSLSRKRIQRLRAQGYRSQSEAELNRLAWGNRFAYIICTVLASFAVGFAYLPLLIGLFCITILGVALPNHPFDYIYNYLLANPLHKPKLPPRSDQLKFACYLASIMLLITIYLFFAGFTLAGYLVGGTLVAIAATVAITDYCLPSAIYNALFYTSFRKSLEEQS